MTTYTNHTHTITTSGTTYSGYATQIYPYAQEYPTRQELVTQPWKQSYGRIVIDPRTEPGGSYTQALMEREIHDQFMKEYREERQKVNTLAKIKAERQEKRERAAIERLFQAWDDFDLDAFENKTYGWFDWTPDRKDAETYSYAIIRANNDKWYITGNACWAATTEQIVDWFVEKKLYPNALRLFAREEIEDA